jgi:hypothetical protein
MHLLGSPDCWSWIRFAAGGAYPYIIGAPEIDYDVTFGFKVVGKDVVEVTVGGNHDSFPDYEAIVQIGAGARQILYSYPSPYTGPGLWSLGRGPEVPFHRHKSYNVPTPACCPGSCANGA